MRLAVATVMTAVLFVAGMPVAAAQDQATLCQGDYVVVMNDVLIRGAKRTGPPHDVTLPAGTYDVTLVSADEHHPADEQPDERWHALLYAGGEVVATTADTPDLPAGAVIQSFDLAEDVVVTTTVTSVAGELISGGRSVEAVCAIFDIKSQNGAPTAADDVAATDEDTPVVIDVLFNDSDPDDDDLTVAVIGGPSSGSATVDPDSGDVTYSPAPDYYSGDDVVFTYEACDPYGSCDDANVTVTVNPINDDPEPQDDSAETAQDRAVVIDLAGNDVDVDGNLDTSSITITSQPSSGVVGAADDDGLVTYTPNPGFVGTDEFAYEVCDLEAACGGPAIVTVTVVTNDEPIAQDDGAVVLEDDSIVISVLANDIDPDGNLDPESVEIAVAPTGGTATPGPTSGEITYMPNPDSVEADVFTYEVCDTFEACTTADVGVVVTPVNDAPSFTAADPPPVVVNAGSVTVEDWADFSAGPEDEAAQVATFVVTSVADPGLFATMPAVDGDGTLTYAPAGVEGSSQFTLSVVDDGGTANGGVDTSAAQSFTIVFGNAPPVAVDDDVTTIEDIAVVIDVLPNDSDPNGDTLGVVTLLSQPDHGEAAPASSADGLITYTPELNYNSSDERDLGPDTFTYEVCDPAGLCDSATVTVDVAPDNDPPQAGDDTAAVLEDGVVVIDVLANDEDIDGDPLEVVVGLVSAAAPASMRAHAALQPGAVRVVPGGIEYTPAPNANGDDGFTYHACDPGGLCDGASVAVDVIPVNDPPTISAENPAAIREDAGAQSVPGWAVLSPGPSDEADQNVAVTVSSVSQPQLFAALPAVDPSGTLTYTPAAGAAGTTAFTVVVKDDGGVANGGADTSAARTYVITIEPDLPPTENRRPDAGSDVVATPAGVAVDITVTANDSDPDGDELKVAALIAPPTSGVAVIVDADTIRYEPGAGFSGEDSFSYQVCDVRPDQLCDVAQVVVDVRADLIDVSTSASVSSSLIGIGQRFSFDVGAENDGPEPATDVVVRIAVPVGVTVVEGGVVGADGFVSWSVGDLAPGEVRTRSFVADATRLGSQTIAVEAVAHNEFDRDSTPGDGRDDDYSTAVFEVAGSGVGGRIFVDANDNGVFDAGEMPPPDPSSFLLTVEFRTLAPATDVASQVAEPFDFPAAAGPGGGLLSASAGAVSYVAMAAAQVVAGGCPRGFVRGADSLEPPFDVAFDVDGTFAAKCGSGQYTVLFDSGNAERLGYALRTPSDRLPRTVPLGIGEGWRFDYALVRQEPPPPQPQWIEGTVSMEMADGELQPVENVTVQATSSTIPSVRLSDVTGGEGTYRIYVPPGTFTVEVLVDDRPVVDPPGGARVVELGPEEQAIADFTLGRPGGPPVDPGDPGRLTVIVWEDRDGDGLPGNEPRMPGAVVRLRNLDDGGMVELTDQDDGRYTAEDLDPGPYEVIVDLGESGKGLKTLPWPREPVSIEPGPNSDEFVPATPGPISQEKPVQGGPEQGPRWWIILIVLLLLIGALIWATVRRPTLFPPPKSAPGSPYPGPHSFDAPGQFRFFGREDETRKLVAMTYANRVTVLFGPSGAGKSSLLVSGYLPALDRDDFELLPIVRFRADEPRRIEGAGNPFVRTALASWAEGEPPQPGSSFAEWLTALPRRKGRAGDDLARVLVFDQFEQIFAPYPERWQQRHDFFKDLEDFLSRDHYDRVVISIQESHLGELEPLLDHLDLQSRARLRLEPLTEDEARAALVGPLEGTGVRFVDGLPEKVVRDLRRVPVERDGVPGHADVEFIDPLRLQLVAIAAWRSRGSARVLGEKHIRTWADTEEALAAFYDEAVREAAEGRDEGDVRRWVETNLITQIGARARASAATVTQLPAESVLRLEAAGLLVRDVGPEGECLLLAHDRFVGPILVSNERFGEQRLLDLSTGLLTRAAATWIRHGRAAEYLLSGDDLAEARALAREHPSLVRGTQRTFLEASEAASVGVR